MTWKYSIHWPSSSLSFLNVQYTTLLEPKSYWKIQIPLLILRSFPHYEQRHTTELWNGGNHVRGNCLPPIDTSVIIWFDKEGIVIAQSDSNASKFKVIGDQNLQSWENFGFQSICDTYVVGGTNRGYGVYVENASSLSSVSNVSSVPSVTNMSNVSSANTFAPGETMYLYVEPVGFTHSPSSNASVNTLHNWYLHRHNYLCA